MESSLRFSSAAGNSKSNDQHQHALGHQTAPGTKFERFRARVRMDMKVIALYKFGYVALKNIIVSSPQIDMTQTRSEQVCVLTGGATGIGFEIVKILLKLDYTVILGVLEVTVMQDGIEKIRESGILTGHVKILHLNLKSLSSVRQFAGKVLLSPEAKQIDLLINNAGIYQKQYEITENGMECHFQVNYLSHFLLPNLLLPRIKETAKAKVGHSSCHIINTTSSGSCMGSLRFDDLTKRKVYCAMKCYADSKLCLVMQAKSMQNRLQNDGITNIQMYAVHPGEIPTDIWHDFDMREALCRPFTKRFCRTSSDGANTVLYPALTHGISENCGGKYFDLHRDANPNPQANDEQMRKHLWDFSVELIKNNVSI